MSVARAPDSACDVTVQPVSTLHLPTPHAFIPYPQFSLSESGPLRHPAPDDNNNKTALPVVSVVTAVSGLCPTISVVSMQQSAPLAPTLLPAVVTPLTVQAANCLTPNTTMTNNTLNITSHLSVPLQQTLQQQSTVCIPALNLTSQAAGVVNATLTPANLMTITHTSTSNNPTSTNNKPTTNNHQSNNSNHPTSSTHNSSSSAKTSNSNSTKSSSSSSSSSQNSNPEQNEDLVKPVFRDGELVLEVECGQNKAILYLSKLCQGSKGPCISFQSSWLTPNEFQFVSGRETAKDWKRSIRHHGKSLKLLLAKGILNVHPTMCDCDGCRQGATLTRKGEKRRIPNGERKPRKPAGSAGSPANDGSSAGAFRPVGSSTMAAHLSAPGAAPIKPEGKRAATDKAKMADPAAASHPKEAANKHNSSQLPASKEGIKSKSSSAPAAAAIVSSPGLGTNPSSVLSPPAPSKLNSLNIPSPAGRSPTFPTPATMGGNACSTSNLPQATSNSLHSPGSTTSSQLCPGQPNVGVAALSPRPQPSALSPRQPAVVSLTSLYPQAAPLVCSGNPKAEQGADVDIHHFQTPASSGGMSSSSNVSTLELDPDHPAETAEEDEEDDDDDDDDLDPDISDDDDNLLGNDSDECQTDEEKSEEENNSDEDIPVEPDNREPEHESDVHGEERSFGEAERNDPSQSDTKDATSSAAYAGEAVFEPISINTQLCEFKQTDTIQRNQEPGVVREMDASVSDASCEQHEQVVTSLSPTVSSPLPLPATTPVTSKATSFSGSCTKVLSVSVTTTNVKSELTWVPPKLSPQFQTYNLQRAHLLHNDPRFQPEGNIHSEPHPPRDTPSAADLHIDSDKNRKSERVTPSKDYKHPSFSVENHVLSWTPGRDFQNNDRRSLPESEKLRHANSSHLSPNFKPQLDNCPSVNDKVNREKEIREKEEKMRLKVKEDKIRREREERMKKDKEREERKDRDRREEKEAERRRQEEKDKKEAASKAHQENTAAKEAAAGEAARRPPGGMAEAAAFSDYMRVLAAGHAHGFMPSTLGYIPSLFPMRAQDSSLPTQLFHQFGPAAYGHQLTALAKDPMLYQTAALPTYGASSHPFGHVHPLLQRHPYSSQQSLLEYQRSLAAAAAASYPWAAAYPYFLHDFGASSSSNPSTNASAAYQAGMKRPSPEVEAAMELNAKRMRMDARAQEYTSAWDYFAVAAAAAQQQQQQQQQQQRAPVAASLPCGLESDKASEFLRKRYLEYGPQAAAYLAALPEYARAAYQCACADHRDDNILMWSVEEVCKFLNSLDGCGVYSDFFREQRVTGRILALLTTDHLVKTMGMKLGPAVLLAEAVAKKLQDSSKMTNCEACRTIALTQPYHPMALPL